MFVSTLFGISIPTSFNFLLKNVFTLAHVLFLIELNSDVNLKRTRIDNNSGQCRVQFIIFVSDSIYMYIDKYLHNKPMCACTYINYLFAYGVYMHIHTKCDHDYMTAKSTGTIHMVMQYVFTSYLTWLPPNLCIRGALGIDPTLIDYTERARIIVVTH